MDNCLLPHEVCALLQQLDTGGTRLQRLLVLLFLSTGLRIGGMQRLIITEHPVEQCRVLQTQEKGNELRTILLSDACHRDLCEWWHTDRGGVDGVYVFPGRGGKGHIGLSYLGAQCKRVLLASGVHTAKAHPHIFRHSTIIMLHVLGVSYETVSKWIGHRSAVLTSSVYGKLPLQTLRAMAMKVPFIGGTATTLDPIIKSWGVAAHLIADPPWHHGIEKKNQCTQ
jgi:site-specific recombinase XerD